MSASSFPEWKQLLLDKKKREEEERERRGKEEEEKLASMPAWKRGIIQRRKAKQESLGDKDREKETEACLLSAEVRSLSDGQSDTDSSAAVHLGSEPSLSPDQGQWLDSDTTQPSQVSVRMNPFICTQSAWRKDRDPENAADTGHTERQTEPEVEGENVWEGEKQDKLNPRGHDGESRKGRNVEGKIDMFRDMSGGRVRDRDRHRESDRSQGRGSRIYMNEGRINDRFGIKEREFLKIEKDHEMKDPEPCSPLLAPLVPCQTIRANNIIIIEQDRKVSDERWKRWRGAEEDRAEEDKQEKRGVKMDLREILAGGGSVTEIRASEVLIIKPPASLAGCGGGNGREEAEKKFTMDGGLSRKVKERPWGQVTVIKGDRRDVVADRGGRVSQLLSKFGERPKPPSRSKSSDNFLKVSIRNQLGNGDNHKRKHMLLKCVPKRSFSFSDRLLCVKDNGVDERKTRERIHSDTSAEGKVTKATVRFDCAQLPNRGRCGDAGNNSRLEPVDQRAVEKASDEDGDKGFTAVSVKNTEGIAFARRVPIRQERKARDGKGPTEDGQKTLELDDVWRDEQLESETSDETTQENHIMASVDSTALYKHKSASKECSGPQESYQNPSELSQHTQDLISKIESIGVTAGEHSYMEASDVTKESQQDAQISSDDSEICSHGSRDSAPVGIVSSPLEIQIPRTVFYVAEELSETKPVNGQRDESWEVGEAVQRRDSWRIGKPLSRIESLREKIRQKALERLRRGDVSDGEDVTAVQAVEDTCEEDDTEKESAGPMGKKLVEAEREQEGLAAQTSAAAFDVTQEVAVLKTCPQLPVSGPFAQAAEGEEEVTCGYTLAEVISDCSQLSDDEDDLPEHVEKQLSVCRRESNDSEGEEKEVEEEEDLSEAEEEEDREHTSHISPSQSLCPSPPHPDSISDMSWIYNLETVCSRSGLSVRDRSGDASSVHLIKVRPLVSLTHQETRSKHGDNTVRSDDEVRGVQQQIEQFHLREQEVKSTNSACIQPKTQFREDETKSPQGPSWQQVKSPDVKIQQKDPQKPERSCRFSSERVYSPTCLLKEAQATQSRTVSPTSPENSLKSTPTSSPLLLSPAASPSVSPSPSPSPTLFTLRSASGGQVRRGATITITPKKATGSGAEASPTKAQTAPGTAEPEKKKHPTVEEIEVIGGYQSLDKSCLVKKRGRRKKVKVCFDKVKLEQVCEYPSETSMLACTPHPPDLGVDERPQGEGEQEEEVEEAQAAIACNTSKSAGITTGRGFRVGQCHPLLKKHNV
ncbi:uncharacterized protein ppp1r18 [Genypterus blacodes]|uniref:uncharacterized protein ppp1r18 n=1 Tax=Genypterus blacodes TaxID=154954 RepID=UPI003F767D92